MNSNRLSSFQKRAAATFVFTLALIPLHTFALMIDGSAHSEVGTEANATSTTNKSQVEMSTTVVGGAEPDATKGHTLSSILDADVLTEDIKADIAEFKGTITPLIQSKEDVKAYAKIVADANPEVKSMNMGANELRLEFKERAKFLGIIPLRITSTAVIESDGTVVVERPWYGSFFRISDKTELVSDIEASLGSNKEASIRAFAANASAIDQVELMRKVVKVIDAHESMSVGASAESTTKVQ